MLAEAGARRPGHYDGRRTGVGCLILDGPSSSRHGELRERPNRHAWKVCGVQAPVGSNPTLSAGWPSGPGLVEPGPGRLAEGRAHAEVGAAGAVLRADAD